MSEKPYKAYIQDHKNMILRDYLAIDRTILANETNYMSFIRTSLTLIAAGATLIKFFNSEYTQALGWTFVAVGGWLAFHGYRRYNKVDSIMHQVKGDYINQHMEGTKRNPAARMWLMKLLGKNTD
ncbi:DUF202 domain-containing protein [bacterium]|nr:MAG: DUF202 domain-containing protein [bacterium]